MRHLGAFLRAIFSDWVAAVSGIASVVLAIIGLLGAEVTPRLVWVSFIVCVLTASYTVWKREHMRLLAYTENRPAIRVADGGLYSDVRVFYNIKGEATVTARYIHLRLTNDPQVHTEQAIARGVTAVLSFFDLDTGNRVVLMDGRWSDAVQPTQLARGDSPADKLLPVDFQIGQTRELDIGFLDPKERFFYPFNNDNYVFNDLKCHERRMAQKFIAVHVRVRAPYVDAAWLLNFRIVDGWEFTQLSVRELAGTSSPQHLSDIANLIGGEQHVT